ncbi:MAG: type II toxin-antitoxin system RelE/ParE family toxin [Candidatus Marinimicrobia bacterium]|nr:type II toxin-antitoxin system RelE/ParE family toxin [Candidatus Neomarinimicrobiota bacterium]MCF7840222.1 type II toxin-antitoxin system RelE/ParE family toxin [Candidatus Neomarinimicrobiota bacterium]
MQLKFTPSARTQFLEGITYIKQDNPGAARHFRQRVEDVLRRLIAFPGADKVIREFQDLPFREIVVPPYRFFYQIKKDFIWIVAVWHSAQRVDLPDSGRTK